MRKHRFGPTPLLAAFLFLVPSIAAARDLPPWMESIIDPHELGTDGAIPLPALPELAPIAPAVEVAAPSLSVGKASRGRLIEGVRLDGAGFRVKSEDNWGTAETVAAIRAGVAEVERRFPGSHPLMVGDLSREHGGRIRPHRSHQSGRDVDLGYFHKGVGSPNKFLPATAANLDLPRTWALLESFMADGKVEYIFIDRSVQKVLHTYVTKELKVAPEKARRIFAHPGGNNRQAVIRHRRGHRNHIHVRFHSPLAVAAGKQHGSQALAALKLSLPDEARAGRGGSHTVKKGETLSQIAKRRKVPLKDLMRWNRLTGRSTLRPGQKLSLGQKAPARNKRGKRGSGA